MESSNGQNNPSGPDNALQAVSNGLVHLMSDSYGRGPTKAKTYILDDTYVCCIMHEIFTTAEQTLIEAGETDLVRRTRIAFQTALSDDFKAVVENALGRRVLTFSAASSHLGRPEATSGASGASERNLVPVLPGTVPHSTVPPAPSLVYPNIHARRGPPNHRMPALSTRARAAGATGSTCWRAAGSAGSGAGLCSSSTQFLDALAGCLGRGHDGSPPAGCDCS
jgi:uncharacterized protein YbcI